MNMRILIISADNLGISIEQVPYQHFEYLKYPVLVGRKNTVKRRLSQPHGCWNGSLKKRSPQKAALCQGLK